MTQKGGGCVARLIAKPPLARAPVTIGAARLSTVEYGQITSVAPFQGQDQAVAEVLKDQGLGWPAVGRSTGKSGARVIWAGLGTAFVLGPAVAVPTGAAVTDQSDGWAVLALENGTDVLARLTPLDLRDTVFKRGHVARSLLGHMNAIFVKTGANRMEILVFRSMVETAWHEITEVMGRVAAETAMRQHAP